MKRILTVGCELPGGHGQHVRFDSKASLLDADFVLFSPEINHAIVYDSTEYQGKRALSDTASFRLKEALSHWKRELGAYLETGKVVFLILCDLDQVFASTGEKEYSGTGRNRQTTNFVNLAANYDCLPIKLKVIPSKGDAMTLVSQGTFLWEYWQQFRAESQYRVYLEEADPFEPFITTRSGGRVVGGIVRVRSGGALIALPWIDFERADFFTKSGNWTSAASEWGRRYVDSLQSMDNAFRRRVGPTPLPQWAQANAFRTIRETALSEELGQIHDQIANLQQQRGDLEFRLEGAGSLKDLLFEQGRPLENAVLEAMRLMGFEANNYRDSDSEFDVVLECPEGRCLGEVEGRDNKPIDITKMRQLEANVQEDFKRDEVSEFAKALLFGNAYRLTAPSNRPAEHFTTKCMTAAQRNRAALIRTCDLFEVARALADNPDPEFAASCRKSIFSTYGEEVRFPEPHTTISDRAGS